MGDKAFYPIAIQVYYDDFETANPIGTKAGLHKLGGFYFGIMNLKRKFNSKLDNKFLLALADRLDISKYGISKILGPLPMSRLEKGFYVELEKEKNALLFASLKILLLTT